MRKSILPLVVLLAFIVACGPIASPTPRPASTTPATLVTLPTITPSPAPAIPTATPTLARPTASPTITQTPTRTRAAVTATTPASARPTTPPTKPPAPRGSLAYHVNRGSIDQMWITNLETGVTTPFQTIGPVMDLVQSTNARFGEFSPDGSKLAYVFAGQLFQPNVLYVLDLRTGNKTPVFSSDGSGGGISSPTWSPNGKHIAFIRLHANQRTWGVYYLNSDGTVCDPASPPICKLRETDQGEQYRGGISWSSSGVFALAANTTGKSDVHKLFFDGTGFQNLTNHVADDTTPVWSPDGKQIAFSSTRDGRAQIYVMNADGAGLRRVSASPYQDFSPAWSPDGNWLAFASTRENLTDIYMMDLHGGNVRRVTTDGADHPFWAK